MNIKQIVMLAIFALLVVLPSARAGNKISLHGIYMVPYGTDAKEVSKPGWGLGGDFLIGLPNTKDVLLGVVGVEYINLMGRSTDLQTVVDGSVLPYTKETDQWYGRLRLGAQIGGFGNGFFRPYLGLTAALVVYAIDTDLNFHPGSGEDDFTEHVYDDIDAVFGCDLTLGADLNVSDHVSVDGGVKYLKSFSVPDQLGGGSVKIYPQYFQIYLGAGISVLGAPAE